MTVQNEKPAESGEIKAPPKKTKTTSNLDAGAVAKFKDMLFARKSYARSRADRTTGENLEDARESALEEERRRLAKEASSTSSVEALVAVGKQASELILQQREQAIQDRFKVGSEKREMLSALESMGKLRLDLATQYPEYFKLQDDGLISFDLGHWIQEESDLIEGHIRNNEERGLVSEIYKRRGEIRAVVREKVSKMIDRVLVVSGKGENNLDLLFLGPDEQEMGLLFLRTLRDSSGRSYSIEKENVPRYKSVLGAVVKAESIFGISHRSEERRVQMRRIIKFSLQAEELFIDSYTAREHLSDTPSILQTNRDEFLGSLSISEMRSFGFENILIGRLDKGMGLGEGSKEDKEQALVDFICEYLKQIKNINDPNDSVFRHVLSSVLGESYGRRGLVESPISKEGKKRIIRTIFESIAMVLKRTEKGYLSGQLEKISETSLAGAIFYNNWSLLLEAISESIKELNLENSDYGIKSLLRGMADVWTKELMKDISTSNPHDLYHFTSRAIRLLSEYQSRLQALKEMSEEAEK